MVREFLNPGVSRSGLDRCLRRHGVAHLRELMPEAEGERAAKQTFKDYVPGFIHVDIKYLPQMRDERARRYLFVAIDRATRWVPRRGLIYICGSTLIKARSAAPTSCAACTPQPP